MQLNYWTFAYNNLVFQNDRLLFIQSVSQSPRRLCLNIELSVPQALNDQFMALCALVDVLNVICELLAG